MTATTMIAGEPEHALTRSVGQPAYPAWRVADAELSGRLLHLRGASVGIGDLSGGVVDQRHQDDREG